MTTRIGWPVAVLAAAVLLLGGVAGAGALADEPRGPTAAIDPHEVEPMRPCVTTMFDVPGPGRPTPEEAVEGIEGGTRDLRVLEVEGGTARVAVLIGGYEARIYRLSRHDDGWWPDDYVSGCGATPATPSVPLSPRGS